MPGASFSILSHIVLIMDVIWLQVLNQSCKHVPWIARWFAKRYFERGASTTSQAILVTESYMQMCSECSVCSVCSVKNSKIRSFLSHFPYSRGSLAWVKRDDRKTGFFGNFTKSSYRPFNFHFSHRKKTRSCIVMYSEKALFLDF